MKHTFILLSTFIVASKGLVTNYGEGGGGYKTVGGGT